MIGRPPKRPEDRLTEVVHFRVTKEELDRLQVRAIRKGVSPNQYLRWLLRVEKS